MVEVVGFEPTTYSVQTSRSSQLELYPHILQNISRAIYLLSASTLLSWSTSHTASYLNLIFRLNKEHQATYFANISNFPVALRE